MLVTIGLASPQPFESIAWRDEEILQPRRDVQHLQLAGHRRPDLSRHDPGWARIPLAEEVDGRLVGEALNHN